MFIGSTKINNHGLGYCCFMIFPSLWKLLTRWSRNNSRLLLQTMFQDIFFQMFFNVPNIFEVFSSLKFSLNFAVQSFDLALKSLFIGGRKNGNDPKRQTKTEDSTNRIPLSGTLKNHIVIELNVTGKSELLPMPGQRIYYNFRSDHLIRNRK